MNKPDIKRVLVTGSSAGIGRAVALKLLQSEWQVLGFDINDASIDHPAFTAVRVDCLAQDALQQAIKKLPSVNAFVHAAGILRTAPLGQLDPKASEQMWRLNVGVAEQLANTLIPLMQAQSTGRVVLIGSRVADGKAGRSQYAASKAALIALARSWAAEVVSHGVTVNVVSPAATDTALLLDPARATSSPRCPPIGRFIKTEEVAAMVNYLLSPPAAVITGQNIILCGGSSLSR